MGATWTRFYNRITYLAVSNIKNEEFKTSIFPGQRYS